MTDKRRFASSTESVHAGTDRKRPHHTLASTIAQTATFTFDDSADLERYMRGEDRSRTGGVRSLRQPHRS